MRAMGKRFYAGFFSRREVRSARCEKTQKKADDSVLGGGTIEFSGTLSLKDCNKAEIITKKIDGFAKLLREKIKNKEFLSGFNEAVIYAQTYAYTDSYYKDLYDLTRRIIKNTNDKDVEILGKDLMKFIKEEFVLYEAHTTNGVPNSHGISVYCPVYATADGIHKACQSSYERSEFSKATCWDELISEYRSLMLK